jgi:hypothetical protein
LILVGILSIAAMARACSTGPAAQNPNPLMMGLADAFSAAEKREADLDLAPFLDAVEKIRTLSAGIQQMPSPEGAPASGFRSSATAVANLAVELARAARAGDRERATSIFEDLRGACVQCHVKYRTRNEERGLYPARGNTVSGAVSVVMLGGKEREDRSNVVVFLDGVLTPPGRLVPWQVHRITQKDARFEPRVLPVFRGESVAFPNDDFIFHNVFSLSESEPFDLGAYGPGQTRSVVFSRTGLVRVYCNIHPQMLSTILVLENPFFATTDAEGRFVISGVPDGTYALRAWQEYSGDHRQSLSLSNGAIVSVPIRIQEDKVTIEHTNKFGLPYRETYR